jgi:hypothetical protein
MVKNRPYRNLRLLVVSDSIRPDVTALHFTHRPFMYIPTYLPIKAPAGYDAMASQPDNNGQKQASD